MKPRLEVSFARDHASIAGPIDAAAAFHKVFAGMPEGQEIFGALLLNTRGRPIRGVVVSIGTLAAALIHPREVFAPAIAHRAASLIIGHTHPSGDPSPSAEDLVLTQRLVKAGELLGIPVMDHIVLAGDRYRSIPCA